MLEKLEPENVFYFFEEICKIPHGSGNTKQISDYLKSFAEERKLYCRQDEWNNIIIIKEASKGYEHHEPVILQGHMDMVAVQNADSPLNMTAEGLLLQVDGDNIYAKGTSLGGDDGIAVAFGLALLDGTAYAHPRIELIITVDEEVGMDGARNIMLEEITAKRMINLDQEEEGVFIAGCAGGARVDIKKEMMCCLSKGVLCKLEVMGLQGGHSGAEIDKERGNAICLLARLLTQLLNDYEISLLNMQGGVADNAIPTQAMAEFLLRTPDSDLYRIQKEVAEKLEKAFVQVKTEYLQKDGQLDFHFQMAGKQSCADACSTEDSAKWILLLNALPHGVISYSRKMKGLVETSLNPGILTLQDGKAQISISVRSSVESAKYALIQQLKSIGSLAETDVTVRGDYPGWDYATDSKLRNKMVEIYRQMYGKVPEIEAIHAGLECGIFQSKLPGLDCVSIGPDMKNIHTTKETLSISSVERTWNYLLKVLENL